MPVKDSRYYSASAYGDNPEELEADAIDKARAIFGDGVPLYATRDYGIRDTEPGKNPGGKKYAAGILVRIGTEPDGDAAGT